LISTLFVLIFAAGCSNI